jgi:integrase
MPRSWSEATKACRTHPSGVVSPTTGKSRACSCRVGWRYRMGRPDAVSGKLGKPEWSQTFPTKDAADDDQRAVRQAIAEGRYATDGGRTVAAWLPEWLDRKAKEGRKASTIEGYRLVIEGRLIPEIGTVRLGRLSRQQVQAMLDRLKASQQRGRGKGHRNVSAGTVRGVHRVLRSALADAKKAGLVSHNVAEDLSLPAVPKHDPLALGIDRVRLWLAWVDGEGDRLSALWHCCATYGPRRGELLGLRWEDVDTTSKLIHLRQTVLDVTGEHLCARCAQVHHNVLFDTPKTEAGARVWPLVPAIEAALLTHKLAQDAEREAYGPDYSDHGLIFCNPEGGPLSPDYVSDGFGRAFSSSGAAKGLDRVPPLKALRSTAVTLLHEQGVPLETIARIVGHSSTQVTKKHYLSISAESVRDELASIAESLSSGGSDRRSDHRAESTRISTSRGGGAEPA